MGDFKAMPHLYSCIKDFTIRSNTHGGKDITSKMPCYPYYPTNYKRNEPP